MARHCEFASLSQERRWLALYRRSFPDRQQRGTEPLLLSRWENSNTKLRPCNHPNMHEYKPSPQNPRLLHRAPNELDSDDPSQNSPQTTTSKQPNIPKQNDHSREKPNPHPPPHARPLRHSQHPIHRPAQPHPRVVERIVHPIRQGRGVADLVADRHGDLYGPYRHNASAGYTSVCRPHGFSFLLFFFR